MAVSRLEEKDDFSCYEMEDEALIWINDDEWIYIISHSWHDSKEIGDQNIAIDSAGNLYKNDGHVCGGSLFISKSKVKPRTPKEFFDNFPGWTGEEWYPILDCGKKSPNQNLHSITCSARSE